MFEHATQIVQGTTFEAVKAWVEGLDPDAVVGHCAESTRCVLANYWAGRIFDQESGDPTVKTVSVTMDTSEGVVTVGFHSTQADKETNSFPLEDQYQSTDLRGVDGLRLAHVANRFDGLGDTGSKVTAAQMLQIVFPQALSRAAEAEAEALERQAARVKRAELEALLAGRKAELLAQYPDGGGAFSDCDCPTCTERRYEYEQSLTTAPASSEPVSSEPVSIG